MKRKSSSSEKWLPVLHGQVKFGNGGDDSYGAVIVAFMEMPAGVDIAVPFGELSHRAEAYLVFSSGGSGRTILPPEDSPPNVAHDVGESVAADW